MRGQEPAMATNSDRQTTQSATPLASPFSREELAQWREVLAQRRNALAGDITALESEAVPTEHITVSSNHLAEGGSDAQEQDFSAIASASDKELVWQIDRAIRKIDTGKPLPFGLCEHTRQPVARERLALMPWTPFSSEAAAYMEAHQLVAEDLLIED
jgi:RNA polymerase-binding transcription factor DksA